MLEMLVFGSCHTPAAVYTGENITKPMVMTLTEKQRKETGFSPWFIPLLIFWAEATSHTDKPERGYVPLLLLTWGHWPSQGDWPMSPSLLSPGEHQVPVADHKPGFNGRGRGF